MTYFVAFVILLSMGIAATSDSEEILRFTEDSPQCIKEDATLICDYINVTKVTLLLEGPPDPISESLLLYNIKKLLINETRWKNLTLHNVEEINVISTKKETSENDACNDGLCTGNTQLMIIKSSIDHIPRWANKVYLEECKVESISFWLHLQSLITDKTNIQMLDLSSSVSNAYLSFRNTSLNIVRGFKIGPNSTALFEDSKLGLFEANPIIVNEGNLTLKNCYVSSARDSSVLMMPKASVHLLGFNGELNLHAVNVGFTKNLSHTFSSTTESLLIASQPEQSYYIAYISFLVLFILMAVLFILLLILKNRKENRETEENKPNNEEERKVFAIKVDRSSRPLLEDTADEAKHISDIGDTIENDITISLDITKALYLEDLEDINADMKTAMDVHQKTVLDEFMKENVRRIQLQDFQFKSRSKIDKNTAMLERLNQAMREWIQEQFSSHVFDIKNNDDEIQLKHKERMVECYNRFSHDLIEISRTAIDNWNRELKDNKNTSPQLVQYLQDLLSFLLCSMNQLQVRFERNVMNCREKYKKIISDLETTHSEYLKNIKASAEKKLELVRNVEKEDSEIFESKKVFQLASIQEDTVNVTETLQKKQAEKECSEVRQQLLLQEEIMTYQKEHIRHIDRIATTLTEIRSCYFHFLRRQMATGNSKRESYLGLGQDMPDACASSASLKSADDLCLDIFNDESLK